MVTAPIFDQLHAALAPTDAPISVVHDVLVFETTPEQLQSIAEQLKHAFAFDIFMDVTAVDWIDQPVRFEVVHHFYSTTHKVRVRLKTRVPESAPHVPSMRPLFNSAAYMERECHDMYGIKFQGNDDLRPILLYEGFQGHPLRKDYPKRLEQPLIPYRF